MKRVLSICFLAIGILAWKEAQACSVLYYLDHQSGKIFVANNEDYWYDVEAYIQIFPASGKKLARLWYGWKNFAQGGINEAGLFFDGAVTPEQVVPEGGHGPRGNLGDHLLARCRTVEDALALGTVGQRFAPGWAEMEGQPTKAVAQMAALNMVSVGGSVQSLSGDDSQAQAVIQGWPAEDWRTFFTLEQTEIDPVWNIF